MPMIYRRGIAHPKGRLASAVHTLVTLSVLLSLLAWLGVIGILCALLAPGGTMALDMVCLAVSCGVVSLILAFFALLCTQPTMGALPERVAAIATPVAAWVLLLIFDWRLGLAAGVVGAFTLVVGGRAGNRVTMTHRMGESPAARAISLTLLSQRRLGALARDAVACLRKGMPRAVAIGCLTCLALVPVLLAVWGGVADAGRYGIAVLLYLFTFMSGLALHRTARAGK